MVDLAVRQPHSKVRPGNTLLNRSATATCSVYRHGSALDSNSFMSAVETRQGNAFARATLSQDGRNSGVVEVRR
jgi:hypothetical protein